MGDATTAKVKLLAVTVSVVVLIVFLAHRQLTSDRGSGNSTPDVALTDHSAQMQVFDRGILYLCSQQESDGRWSSVKSGADPESNSINGDIAVTAVVTSALLDACSNKQNNPDAQLHAKRGLEWLSQRVRADGGIADESAAGEPVAAQLLAALTFLQAGELSAREKLGIKAERICQYAATTLQASCGGFGATKNSAVARADLTALGAVMYDKARAANIALADAVDSKAEQDFERKFDRSIRNGIAALRCQYSTGLLALSTDQLEPNWDATAAGLLADVVQMIQGTETQARLCFMTCASTDPGIAGADSTFPGMERQLRDEPHSAFGIFAGSVVITRVYSSTLPVRIAWTKTVLAALASKQLSDGSWAAEGPDATRGRLWRTAFNVRIALLLAH